MAKETRIPVALLVACRKARDVRRAKRRSKRSEFRHERRVRRIGDRIIAALSRMKDFSAIEQQFAV